MSRAFVKETDAAEVPVFPEPTLPPGVANVITPEGAARFRDRHAAATGERAAVGEGGVDRDRHAALTAELRWLERRMATFVETAPPPDPNRVAFGVTVDLDGQRPRTVRIVGVDEADPASGAISWQSPLARALLGRAPGDAVELDTPAGWEEWEIVAVRAS